MSKNFECKSCEYTTNLNGSYVRHLKSAKHLKNQNKCMMVPDINKNHEKSSYQSAIDEIIKLKKMLNETNNVKNGLIDENKRLNGVNIQLHADVQQGKEDLVEQSQFFHDQFKEYMEFTDEEKGIRKKKPENVEYNIYYVM
jgi:hypothetical protein